MKKILVVLLALLCVGAAFAEGNPGVSIGAWGRQLFTVGSNGTDITTGLNASWGGSPRIGFTIASNNSANIGFQLDGNVDSAANFGLGDNQKVWAKLLDGMITVQVGNFFDDTLRGNAAYGAWNWSRYSTIMMGEDAIFMRVCQQGTTYLGADFEVAVASSGFYGFAALNGLWGNTTQLIEDAFANGQYGAGYTIPDIGVIRAQYIGIQAADAGDAALINAAFKLTMVKGLTVDLGVYIPVDSDLVGFTAMIPVFASYNLGTVTVNASAAFTVIDPDSEVRGGLGADVDLGNGLGLNADVNIATSFASGSDLMWGFMAGVTKGLGNGLIGVGVEVSNDGFASGYDAPTADDIAWVIPVRLEYWF